ncbi:MAG: OsmC family protein [Candidatus Bathyarchaeia archaeon]
MSGELLMNNIRLEKVKTLLQEAYTDASKTVEAVKLSLRWGFDKRGPQVYSEIQTERAVLVLESELPTFLGGQGFRPSPIQYFLYGVAASFLSSLMLIASLRGLTFEDAVIELDSNVNHSSELGLVAHREPIKVSLRILLRPSIPEETLHQLLNEANSRCPILAPINLEINVIS